MTSHQSLSEPGHPLGPEYHLQAPDHLVLLGPGHHLLQVQTNYRALGTNAHLDCHQHSVDLVPVHLLVEPQSLQSYDVGLRYHRHWLVNRSHHPEHHLHYLSLVSRRNHQGL